jgi:hypothetical protein
MYQDGVQLPPVEAINSKLMYGSFSEVHDIDGILTGMGYSNTALCWLGALLFVCVLVACTLRYPTGLHLRGTNHAVISATCHVRPEEMEHGSHEDGDTGRAVIWGVTIRGGGETIGHCSFTTEDVQWPTDGHLYAGYGKPKSL